MAVIIDNNRRSDFSDPKSGHAGSIVDAVSRRQAKIAVCRDLLAELTGARNMRELLAEWGRLGRLLRADEGAYARERAAAPLHACKSDDPHILALARSTNARLLYTEDLALIEDFKNVAIVAPKGKVITLRTKGEVVQSLLRQYGV